MISTPPEPGSPITRALSTALPLLLAIAITLVLRGYQFGGGNHCVYLIAPLRELDPTLLANDWWTTHTLQYHLAFTHLSAALMRLDIIEPAFLAFYLALVLILHLAWQKIVRALGLDSRAYLLSVMLYYLSAGGTGLGSYQFLQDSSFLPGNVANVAMLWGLALWIERRTLPSALALGIAALFHLNHAIVALAFFPIATCFHDRPRPPRRLLWDRMLLAYSIILLLALPNLIPAAKLALSRAPRMPLPEFVDLYVHLRHPHHYDPLSWPIALWLSFLWPLPLACFFYRRAHASPHSALSTQHSALSRAGFTTLFFLTLQLLPLCFAGLLYLSEPLIQMSLFRFSIYPKLLTCIGVAAFLLNLATPQRQWPRRAILTAPILVATTLITLYLLRPQSAAGSFIHANLPPLLLLLALFTAGTIYILRTTPPARRLNAILIPSLLLTLAVGWNRWLGLHVPLDDDADSAYLKVCEFARDHTPTDAVFLVPPNEQLFRYHARRAAVINFKNVPQLSIEMTERRNRLEAVLGTSLSTLPKRFDLAHAAIARAYDDRPTQALIATARRYNARYLLTARPQPALHPVFENDAYHLYDLAHSGKE